MSKPTRKIIAEAVLGMLQAGAEPKAAAQAFAAYLVDERRTRELSSLVRDLENLRFQRDGVLEATVTSARDLEDTVVRRISELLPAKKVQLHQEHDPRVVGGVRLVALDRQLDLSIESKLKHLKNLVNNAA